MAKEKYGGTREDRIFNELQNMTHRDLQKACIIRGMEFMEIIDKGHHTLVGFFFKHYEEELSPAGAAARLVEYDMWIDKQLSHLAENDPLRHPSLRFGYIAPILEGNPNKLIKAKVPKEEKVKGPARVKNDEWGITTGTKKYMTYELTITDRLPMDKVIEQVKTKFPDAAIDSVKIWHKRALKLIPAKK